MIEMKKYLVFILCVCFLQSCGSKRTIYNYEDDRILIIADNSLIYQSLLGEKFKVIDFTLSPNSKIKDSLNEINDLNLHIILLHNRDFRNLNRIRFEKEIEAIKTAVEITDRAFSEVFPMIKIGVEEQEIGNQLSFLYRKYGDSDADAFSPIVGSGPHSAMPHQRPTDKKIGAGELVVIDSGAKYAGYHADMTRTVATKGYSEKQKEIYDIVLHAQLESIEGIKAGVSCKEIDWPITTGTSSSIIFALIFVQPIFPAAVSLLCPNIMSYLNGRSLFALQMRIG